MRIGFDIDGVLFDFEKALRNHLISFEIGDPSRFNTATKWKFYEDWGLTAKDFGRVCNDAVNNHALFESGSPMKGYTLLERIEEAGHEIILVTARDFGDPVNCRIQTEDWLNTWQIPYHELHFTRDKSTVHVDYFIDDKLDNYSDLFDAGVKVFLCDRPYNREVVVGMRGTLEDYVEWVLNDSIPEDKLSASDLDDLTVRPDEVRVTSATGGQKGKKLARFDLIPPRALWQVAELYGVGAEKYEDWNWRKGYDWSLSISALERHLALFKMGIDYDDETKCAHLTSVVFHALTLLTFMEEQRAFDDRFKNPRSEGLESWERTYAREKPARPSEAPENAPEGHCETCGGTWVDHPPAA